MSEQLPEDNQSPEVGGWIDPGPKNIQLAYILYLLSFVVGFSVLIGLVFSYMNRGVGGETLDSHYTYLIRTFWIGLLYALISFALAVVLIGFLLMFVAAIWMIIRCVKGLQAIARNEPVPNPQTWLI
ncbi:MAG: DUF4870 family protein [Hyphomicrobiales bacterium]